MEELPKDPAMLMSFLNMKLRDNYSSLDELCEDMDIDRHELLDRMKKLGMEYLPEQNKFWWKKYGYLRNAIGRMQ